MERVKLGVPFAHLLAEQLHLRLALSKLNPHRGRFLARGRERGLQPSLLLDPSVDLGLDPALRGFKFLDASARPLSQLAPCRLETFDALAECDARMLEPLRAAGVLSSLARRRFDACLEVRQRSRGREALAREARP
jgi:hypothetical protein